MSMDTRKGKANKRQTAVSWHKYDGGFWIRVFGRGFSVVDKAKHPPLFSERIGKRRVLRIGRFGIEWLKRDWR